MADQDYQSYFRLRAPVDHLEFKKCKRYGKNPELCRIAANFTAAASPLGQAIFNDGIYDNVSLTVMEQPRSKNEKGLFRYQPIRNDSALVEIVEIIAHEMASSEPLKLGGHGFHLQHKKTKKENKVLLVMDFNIEAQGQFAEFYGAIKPRLAAEKFYDVDNMNRKPQIMVAKAYIDAKNSGLIKPLEHKVENEMADLRTKPILFDRFIMEQGLYTIHGHLVETRDVATIRCDGTVDWHCPNPLQSDMNDRHIKQAANVRRVA